ncbi:uncharacterized protein [Antedon mediterranea]|uniref:uncharacterized protein n=1 Tax=Antedon mediterranea TaxID=105859 RepID=UPI003AF81126
MVKPLRNDSQRCYQCQIQQANGAVKLSDPSTLTVYYLDQPLLGASASTTFKGETVTFTCSKPGGDPIPYITWYKDGRKIDINPSRYKIANNSTESVLKIKSATEEDGGRYTCKAESDQFKGEDAKTSEGRQLNIYHIIVTFKPKHGFATCTAEGYPKLSSVLILQDEEVIEEGYNSVTLETNNKICQSSLTCYAENEKCNNTVPLQNCNAGPSYPKGTVITLSLILGSVLTFIIARYIYVRRIKENNFTFHIPHQGLQFPSKAGDYKEGYLASNEARYRPKIQREVNKIERQDHQYQDLQVSGSSDGDDGYVKPTFNTLKCIAKVEETREEIKMEPQNHQYQGLISSNSVGFYEEPHYGVSSTSNKGKVAESHYCKQIGI